MFGGLTVAENLAARRVDAAPRPRRRARRRPPRCSRCSRCSRERADVAAADLSGGQQQMLALGMAFVARPRVLLIDELSLGLAPVVVGQLLPIVQRLAADGVAVVLVEQSVNVALTVAERAYFMERGTIRFSGPTAELLERPDLLRSVFLSGQPADAGATPPSRRRSRPATRRSPSRSTASSAASAASAPSTGRRSTSTSGRSSASSDRTAPARRRSSTSSPGSSPLDAGRVVLAGHDITSASPSARGRGRPRAQLPGRPAVPGDDGDRDARGRHRALGRRPQRARRRAAPADGLRRRGAHARRGPRSCSS